MVLECVGISWIGVTFAQPLSWPQEAEDILQLAGQSSEEPIAISNTLQLLGAISNSVKFDPDCSTFSTRKAASAASNNFKSNAHHNGKQGLQGMEPK